MTLPHYKCILVVSHDDTAVQRMVTGIESDARLCRIVPPENRYAKTTYISPPLSTPYLAYIEGSCWVDGIVLTGEQLEIIPALERGFYPCEAASALAFMKVMILWFYSQILITATPEDVLAILGTRPICVEERPGFTQESGNAHSILTIKGDLGVCFIIKFERAWEQVADLDGFDVGFLSETIDDTHALCSPDDDYIIFDLCEPEEVPVMMVV